MSYSGEETACAPIIKPEPGKHDTNKTNPGGKTDSVSFQLISVHYEKSTVFQWKAVVSTTIYSLLWLCFVVGFFYLLLLFPDKQKVSI